MPTSGGPNTLGESNLVFAYDIGDTRNSYIGEPTTNLLAAVGSDAALERSGAGYPYYAVDINSVVQSNWSAGNNTLTISFEGKRDYAVGGTGGGGDGYPVFYVYFTDWSWGATLGITSYDWTTNSYTFTMPNPSGKYVYFSIYHMNAGNPGKSYSRNHQIEFKSHKTQFVNGTRSATQGLLPLIGNSTLDLTNMSFDSNAKINFDGTNDYISCGTLSLDFSQGITAEVVANFTNTGTWQRLFDFGNGAGSDNILFARYSSTNYLWFEIYNGGSSVSINTAGGIINNQTCHYVVTVNGSIAYVYRDGVLINSGTFATVPTTISRTNCYIGKSNWADSYFQGDIPVVKMYNRALTAQEVKQNYQQYKTRFKLL